MRTASYYHGVQHVQVRRRVQAGNALGVIAELADFNDGGVGNVEALGFFSNILKSVGSVVGGLIGGGDKKTEVVVQPAPAAAPATTQDGGMFGQIANLLALPLLERLMDRYIPPAPGMPGIVNSTLPMGVSAPTVWAGAPITSPKPSGFTIDGKTLAIGAAALAGVGLVVLLARR